MPIIHADLLGHDSFTADVRVSVFFESSKICRVKVLDKEKVPLLDDPLQDEASTSQVSVYEKDILRIPVRHFPLMVLATECGTNQVFEGGPFVDTIFPDPPGECLAIVARLAAKRADIGVLCLERSILKTFQDILKEQRNTALVTAAAFLAAAIAAAAIPFFGWATAAVLLAISVAAAATALRLQGRIDDLDKMIADRDQRIAQDQTDFKNDLEKAEEKGCLSPDFDRSIPTCSHT